MGRSCEFLRRYAQPGDVVITNYEAEPLYFYTRLPQGLKILANAPIYEAARRQQLPDYIFGVARARWIIWRFAWDGYFGITWSEVEQALISRGARITEMRKIKETGWENRENVFFYRFDLLWHGGEPNGPVLRLQDGASRCLFVARRAHSSCRKQVAR